MAYTMSQVSEHRIRRWILVTLALAASITTDACGSGSADRENGAAAGAPPAQMPPVSQSLEMGGAKSVTKFFITSRGPGKGGNLGGLAGADAHCQALADAEGSGDHTWRAYLSTSGGNGQPAVNARDRIGKGPWYNAEGLLVAENVEQLHSDASRIDKETAVTERLDPVNGVGESPNRHDIIIEPGDDVEYQDIVNAMDQTTGAGFRDFSLSPIPMGT